MAFGSCAYEDEQYYDKMWFKLNGITVILPLCLRGRHLISHSQAQTQKFAIILTKPVKLLMQHTSKNTLAEPENNKEHYDLDSSDSNLNSS